MMTFWSRLPSPCPPSCLPCHPLPSFLPCHCRLRPTGWRSEQTPGPAPITGPTLSPARPHFPGGPSSGSRAPSSPPQATPPVCGSGPGQPSRHPLSSLPRLPRAAAVPPTPTFLSLPAPGPAPCLAHILTTSLTTSRHCSMKRVGWKMGWGRIILGSSETWGVGASWIPESSSFVWVFWTKPKRNWHTLPPHWSIWREEWMRTSTWWLPLINCTPGAC